MGNNYESDAQINYKSILFNDSYSNEYDSNSFQDMEYFNKSTEETIKISKNNFLELGKPNQIFNIAKKNKELGRKRKRKSDN